MNSYFIPFKTRGGTIVDWDFQSVIHCLPWHIEGNGYIVTDLPIGNQKYKPISMHRLLMNFPEEVDHINGIRDCNKKSNLRSVTHAQNQQNQKCHRLGKFIGCVFDKRKNPEINKSWQSKIRFNGKDKSLGYFYDPLSASIVYKLVWSELYG